MSDKIVTLDVREDLRNGREPFSKVMGAAAHLQSNESLLLASMMTEAGRAWTGVRPF